METTVVLGVELPRQTEDLIDLGLRGDRREHDDVRAALVEEVAVGSGHLHLKAGRLVDVLRAVLERERDLGGPGILAPAADVGDIDEREVRLRPEQRARVDVAYRRRGRGP